MRIQSQPLPQTGFLRLNQIVGNRKANPPIPAIIPFSKSTLWSSVKSGKFPAPLKIGGITVWRIEVIVAWIEANSVVESAPDE